MKAFNEWWERDMTDWYESQSLCRTAWQAALEWVLQHVRCPDEFKFDSIEKIIEEELGKRI